MTEIIRDNFVNQPITSASFLVAESFNACPEEVQHYINEKEGETSFDKANSICLYGKNNKIVYGYILATLQNIPNIKDVFKESPSIHKFLSSSQGLYIKKIVLDDGVDNNNVTYILNVLHLTYCEADLTDDTKYIWLNNNGEIIFARTKQDEKFYFEHSNSINNVSKAFYQILYKTNLDVNMKL